MVENYEEFWLKYNEIKIGDEFSLDTFNNIKKNIWYFFDTIDFEDFKLYPSFYIIPDENIPFISDDANTNASKEFMYEKGELIYDGFPDKKR